MRRSMVLTAAFVLLAGGVTVTLRPGPGPEPALARGAAPPTTKASSPTTTTRLADPHDASTTTLPSTTSTTDAPEVLSARERPPVAVSPPTTAEPAPAPAAPVGGALAAIRACESGGDYGAVNASGRYRGAYQFDRQTWAGVGGTGDPAAASIAEQDKRAAMLYAERGASPWPVCGR